MEWSGRSQGCRSAGRRQRTRRWRSFGFAVVVLGALGTAVACGSDSGLDAGSATSVTSPPRPTLAAPTAPPTTVLPPPTLPAPTAPPTTVLPPPTLPPPTAPPAPVPVLGNPNWTPYSMGFGEVRPDGLSNGGDPSGIINDVTWDNWGGPTATGHGIAVYVGPNETVAAASSAPAVIVAFDLGDCEGRLGYRKVVWYHPQFGETFNPSDSYPICNPSS